MLSLMLLKSVVYLKVNTTEGFFSVSDFSSPVLPFYDILASSCTKHRAIASVSIVHCTELPKTFLVNFFLS